MVEDRFAVHAATVERVESSGRRLRIVALEGTWDAGSDRRRGRGRDPDAAASPLLRAGLTVA